MLFIIYILQKRTQKEFGLIYSNKVFLTLNFSQTYHLFLLTSRINPCCRLWRIDNKNKIYNEILFIKFLSVGFNKPSDSLSLFVLKISFTANPFFST